MSGSFGHLRPADIIVSTTDATVSKLIRSGTGGSVSHAMLYLGQGKGVVEAIESGVQVRPLARALDHASLAIALRRRDLGSKADEVMRHAVSFAGRPYDKVGAAGAGLSNQRGRLIATLGCTIALGPMLCGIGGVAIARNASAGKQDDAFFCSELVSRAFELAGVPIVDGSPSAANPRTLRVSPYLLFVTRVL
jgi:uncharacterized protein YycO